MTTYLFDFLLHGKFWKSLCQDLLRPYRSMPIQTAFKTSKNSPFEA